MCLLARNFFLLLACTRLRQSLQALSRPFRPLGFLLKQSQSLSFPHLLQNLPELSFVIARSLLQCNTCKFKVIAYTLSFVSHSLAPPRARRP